MIHLVYGSQDFLVLRAISVLVKKKLGDDINELNYRHFDLRESLIKDIVEECETVSFFGADNKVVVMDHSYFLEKDSQTKVRLDKKQDFDSLLNYIKNPFEEVDLIIAVRSNLLNETNKVFKAIQEKGKITALKEVTPSDWTQYVQGYFIKEYQAKISREAADLLGERLNFNLTTLLAEAKKLSSYTKDIQIEDVSILTPKPLDNDVFLMINSMTKNDKKTALGILRGIRNGGVDNEPVRLLMLISSQLRTLSQILYLRDQGQVYNSIASSLSINAYRVKKALENAAGLKIERVYEALDSLYELDNKIKNRLIDGFYGLELFLLNQNFK